MAAKDSVPLGVPYKNLKIVAEVEMVEADESPSPNHLIDLNSPPPSSASPPPRDNHSSLMTLILSCTIAAGVQFGWALQLSLLTPYIQTLGIEHAFSSFIWLCGPITGLVVQPCVGIWSDKCTSKYGRRRPFILIGSLMISAAVILIGFSADIGYLLGDTKEHCSTYKGTRMRAAIVFIIGFWMLDLANNTVQGPARALLADLSGPDQRNSSNAVFCSWMAVGNILGFSAGASGNWHRWFPFLTSKACCEACANLKAAFLVAVVFLTLCSLVTLYFAKEVPLSVNRPHHLTDTLPLLDDIQQNGLDMSKSKSSLPIANNGRDNNTAGDYERDVNLTQLNSKVEDHHNESFSDGPGAVLVNLLTSLRHLPLTMHSVLIVMALTWLSWFPFFLFDTDWMGREVYHGDPKGDLSDAQRYNQGVREGTAIISLVSIREYSEGVQHVIGGSAAIRIAALVLFALLGFPLAITYSVPFSVTAELTADSGGGQGLAIGVLNLAIVVPQMIVSLGAGPWDALFGGGNIPAFVLASISGFAAGVIAIRRLPNLSSSSYKSSGFHLG
ncbi:sucrose transport protein SUC3-like isoform X3 [Carya illinoinensis]|uniref:sucrose transport protein SUC3-like isoform X3 n=1 Tax=Carya illinoinensis TaxID=32201 RepID=UPI001C71A719|nr:sucrose transport protein SUC3-like isoform X3 [Carya illinoinensis]